MPTWVFIGLHHISILLNFSAVIGWKARNTLVKFVKTFENKMQYSRYELNSNNTPNALNFALNAKKKKKVIWSAKWGIIVHVSSSVKAV